MSSPDRPRQRFRKRSGHISGFEGGSSLSCLGSLGVVQSAVAPESECAFEVCECEHSLAELAQSFEIMSDEAFTLGEFTVTPLRPR